MIGYMTSTVGDGPQIMNRRIQMDTVIKTEKGLVKGVQEGSCLVFKNIPYAKPPVGELRFKRPVETDAWEEVLDCTKFGKITVQEMPGDEKPWEKLYHKEFYSDPEYLREMGEDCLNLNVWTPAKSPEEKLPVAFWIHGGGFGGGYSSEIEFGGEAYGKNGVILVTIEYRCGALGFLAHPWLSAEDEHGVSGNYGIFDQIAALEWVYRNISAFGGDPENITVFGQSAGCMSTQVLVSSELPGTKIAKAILQSGVQVHSRIHVTPTLKQAEAYGERIVELTGAKNLEELRQLPAEEIMKAKSLFDGECFRKAMAGDGEFVGGLVIVPNVDGYLLKKDVRKAFEDGDIRKIPYMAGCVTDDLGTTDENRKEGIPGILLKECQAWCAGAAEKGCPDCYCYLFSAELPGENGNSDVAFHSAELWYMMGTLNRCWRPMENYDQKLSERMMAAWTGFMKTGSPAQAEKDWAPCTGEDGFVKEFC